MGDDREELLLRDVGELVEPAQIVGQGGDVALLQRAEVRVGGRSVRGLAALGQLGGQVGPPPLEEAEPGDGFEDPRLPTCSRPRSTARALTCEGSAPATIP